MSKTLGQVADDRFNEILAKPDADEATAWQAAANAVIRAWNQRVTPDRVALKALVARWRERATIDFAARAYSASGVGRNCADELERALQGVEDE